MQIASIILSAGKGTRMRSDFPKTFHKIAGKKMIDWVIDVNKSINPDKIIIVVILCPTRCSYIFHSCIESYILF